MAFEEMIILASEKEMQLMKQEAGIITAGFESDTDRKKFNSSSATGRQEEQ